MTNREIEDAEFIAFRAGFEATGEGHNGEYVFPYYYGKNYERMLREHFDEWVKNGRPLNSAVEDAKPRGHPPGWVE